MYSPCRRSYDQGMGRWVPENAWSKVGSHQFAYPPSILEGGLDNHNAYAVNANGSLFLNSLSRHGLPASEWKMVADGFTGEVAVASFEEIYLIGLKDGEYQCSILSGARDDWQPLGIPEQCRGEADLGWPMVVSRTGDPSLILVTCGGKIWYKTNSYEPSTRCSDSGDWDWNPADCWSKQWTPFGDSLDDLYHLTHAQARTSNHIFSRTSTGCVYQIGAWEHGHWQKLWCPASPRALRGDDARNLTLAVDETSRWALPQSFKSPPISLLIGDVDGKLYYNLVKPASLAVDMHVTSPSTGVDGRPYQDTSDPVPSEDRVIPPFHLLERPE